MPETEYIRSTGTAIGYIYAITNTINGKRYVGQTRRSVDRRWREHVFQPSRATSLVKRAVKKYGSTNFNVETLAEVDCSEGMEVLNLLETRFIKNLGTLSPFGYNLDAGGKNKNTHPDTKAKMSIAHQGQRQSAESRAKRSSMPLGAHYPLSIKKH